LGACGTFSSVYLRRHHPDLMALTVRSRDRALIDAANLEALDLEIRAAKSLANCRGHVAVNVMRALSEFASYVLQSCESGE
ncbi:nitronate monooxygenase, partial [Burkholderia pseudomallei]